MVLVAVLGGGVAGAVTTPSAPQTLTGLAGDKVGQVSLSWTAPSNPGGGVRTYLYDVSTNYNATTQQGTFGALVNLNRSTTTAPVVPCAAVYPAVCTYRLYARNDAGTSPPSTPFTVAWTVPSAARNLSVQAANFADATLKWNAPTDTGGLVDHYNVEVSNDGAITWTALATNITTTTLSAPGSCTGGTVCEYRVWARNAVGIASVPSKRVLVNVAPGRVQSFLVTHTADDVTTGNPTSGTATMVITWSAPTSGLHDGPYELQECPGTCLLTSLNWSTIELIPNGTTTATRTCGAGVVTCNYRVRATNLRGGVSLFDSSRYAPASPPLTSVATGTAPGTVIATFGAVQGTGPAISTAHFQFWVCTASCGTAASWTLSPTTLAFPPSAVPTVTPVTCPTSGASCSVRVQFVNDAGNKSVLSSAKTANAA